MTHDNCAVVFDLGLLILVAWSAHLGEPWVTKYQGWKRKQSEGSPKVCATGTVSPRIREAQLRAYIGIGQGLQESQKVGHENELVFRMPMPILFVCRKVYWHVLFGEDDELPMRAENAGLCLARYESAECFSGLALFSVLRQLFLRIRDLENESLLGIRNDDIDFITSPRRKLAVSCIASTDAARQAS